MSLNKRNQQEKATVGKMRLPTKIEPFWTFLFDQQWPTGLLQNEGSCAHGFAWKKKTVPYKSPPGFYKDQKCYKKTAHLQKHVPKMVLGIQFSY